MSRLAFLTENAPTGYVSRSILIPDTFVPAVTGALSILADVWKWEQFDTLTPEQCTEFMQEMLFSFLDGEETSMIGSIVPIATEDAPAGMLLCDGASYDRIDYPYLYAVLASEFIDDADTFTVPDLRSRVIVGAGQGSGLSERDVAETGGAETHQLSIAELPAHTHAIHTHAIGLDVESAGVPDLSSSPPLPSELTSPTGSNNAHENMPPFIGLHYAIVAYEGRSGVGGELLRNVVRDSTGAILYTEGGEPIWSSE